VGHINRAFEPHEDLNVCNNKSLSDGTPPTPPPVYLKYDTNKLSKVSDFPISADVRTLRHISVKELRIILY